jgi:GntR family transcriptional regulator, rspAB operon transcriptional repressor
MNPFELLRNTVVIDPAKSIADQIYETLKNSIVRREIEPNQRLFEAEVATSFHASRTPVREAFRRLEQDGIAERLAQGGIRVPQLDAESIQDLFDLRVILEVYAMELACERIKVEDIAYLKQIRAQAEELLKTGDVSQDFTLNRFYELNSMFHDYIYSATRSKFLIKVLNNIRAMVMSMRSVSIRLDSIREVWDEHSRLIDHLERREKKAATRLIRQHVLRTANQVLSFVRSKKGGGLEIEGPSRRRSRKRSTAKHQTK